MVARWDPYTEMVSLREAMNRLVNDSFSRSTPTTGAWNSAASVPFDLCESAEEVVLRVALPGIDTAQLELTVNQGTLFLKGYRSFYSGDQEKQYTWHARGLTEGNFQFAFTLPSQVNADAAQASYDAGVLTIHLPKAEAVKPKRITVNTIPAPQAIESGSR